MAGIAATMTGTSQIPSAVYPKEMYFDHIDSPLDLQAFQNNIKSLEANLLTEDFDEGAFLQQFFTNENGEVSISSDETTDSILGESNNVVELISKVISQYGDSEKASLAVTIAQHLAENDILARFDLDGLEFDKEIVTPLLTIRKTSPINVEITLNTWERDGDRYIRKEVPDFKIHHVHVQDTITATGKSGSYVGNDGKKVVKGKGPWGTILTLIAIGGVALGLASARNKASGGVVVSQEQVIPPVSSPVPADFNPTPFSSPTESPTSIPTETPVTLESLSLIPQHERIAMVPDLNDEVESGLQMYASELRPDVVVAFDKDGNPVKVWNILENRWIPINDIPEVSNGSRGKAWEEAGVQVYRKLNGDFLETPFIPPFPVENGVKDDRAVRYYPTFSNVYDVFEYIVNVEGARYTLQDNNDYAKSDPGAFTRSARETLYRSPSNSHIVSGDFQTPDGQVSFRIHVLRHPTKPGVFVIPYVDYNRVSHFITLVLDDSMSESELESLLEKSLADPKSPESIIPPVSY